MTTYSFYIYHIIQLMTWLLVIHQDTDQLTMVDLPGAMRLPSTGRTGETGHVKSVVPKHPKHQGNPMDNLKICT